MFQTEVRQQLMQFWKGHALGNDYIVLDPPGGDPPDGDTIRRLCDRHRGVGGDGVLVADRSRDPVGLRIFNPDGSEAEKSGNGLRIFGAWLYGEGHVGTEPFEIALPGETVTMGVVDAGSGDLVLTVAMGRPAFAAGRIPYTAVPEDAEILGESIEVAGEGEVAVHLVSMGNPHCVVFADTLDEDRFRRLAPAIQAIPAFAEGVNVQLARVAGPDAVEIRIWERGAGETMASGSSACAVVVAARRAGRVGGEETEVRMPGGSVRVAVAGDGMVRLTGAARIVFAGRVDLEALPATDGATSGPSGS